MFFLHFLFSYPFIKSISSSCTSIILRKIPRHSFAVDVSFVFLFLFLLSFSLMWIQTTWLCKFRYSSFQNRKSAWTENKQEKYLVCRVWKQSKDGGELVWTKTRRINFFTSNFPELFYTKLWYVVKTAEAMTFGSYGLSCNWCGRWLSTFR